MTPEELAAEKIRQQKLQEEVELAMVKSTFGNYYYILKGDGNLLKQQQTIHSLECYFCCPGSNEVDVVDPMTKDDFDALRKKIIGDLRKFEKRVPFEDFLEDFIQDLCLSLPSKRLKKVKATVEALYFEKNKAEKATTATKGKRTGGKVKLTVESDITNVEVGYELDDYDDFM